MELHKLTVSEATHLRPIIEPMLLLAEVYAEGELSVSDIFEMIELGLMQAWIVGSNKTVYAVGVTEICVYPRMRALKIVAVAGAYFEKWKHLEAFWEHYARQQGCSRIEAYTRPGMAKKLSSMGYRSSRQLVTKYVNGVAH